MDKFIYVLSDEDKLIAIEKGLTMIYEDSKMHTYAFVLPKNFDTSIFGETFVVSDMMMFNNDMKPEYSGSF